MTSPTRPPEPQSMGSRWREGVARQARTVYESAHGNPVSDDARGVRWALAPRVALTVAVALAICAGAVVWSLRDPGGDVVGAGGGQSDSAEVAAGVPNGGAGESGEVGGTASPTPRSWGDAPADGTVIVHVAGDVVSPGLQHLPAGSRVGDAIDAAGGFTADADTAEANLARILVDGEQVYIPAVGPQAGEDDQGGAGAANTAPAQHEGGPDKVNINRADAAELESLPGVGPVLAQRIEEYRDSNGPFVRVADLQEVSGIGPSLMAKMEEVATV